MQGLRRLRRVVARRRGGGVVSFRRHAHSFEEEVRLATDALRSVRDPLHDDAPDVVSSGMASVVGREASLAVSLDVRTAAHPEAFGIAEDCRRALEGSGISSDAEITLVAGGFGASIGPQDSLAKVRACVAVASCKGGVGKSTVAAQLAYALLKRGGRVGLLDADVHGPSAPTQLGLTDARVEASPAGGGLALPVEARGGLRVASLGFVNVAASRTPGVALRGPLAGRVAAQLFSMTDWGELDYLVVDLPPGVGDVTLAVCAAVNVEAAVVVTTPSMLAKADVLRGLDLQEGLGLPTCAVVENLAEVSCQNCGENFRPFGSASVARDVARAAGLPADLLDESTFAVPVSRQVAAANDGGIVGYDDPLPVFDALAAHVVKRVYNAMHDRKDALLDVKYDAKHDKVVFRTFADGHANEASLDPAAVRRHRDAHATLPPDLRPTRVSLVGNRSVVFDWSDGRKDDVYAVRDLVAIAEPA